MDARCDFGFYARRSCAVLVLCVACVRAAGSFTTKIGPKPMWNATFTDILRHDLLLNYDKFARPAQHYNVTTVDFDVNFRHFQLNEFKSTLTVYCWLRVQWRDEKLKWNPADYGGLKLLRLAEHEIWQPDIFLYNSATSTSINHYSNMNCLADPSGWIIWVPSAQFSVLCSFDLTHWPFDTQTCELRFGSWSHHGEEIDITLLSNGSDTNMSMIITNVEWNLVKVQAEKKLRYYQCCKEPYPIALYTVTLKRNPSLYKAIVVTPIFVIAFLTLLTFWMPPHSGEKVLLNGCVAIINAVFLLYLAQKIPAIGSSVPYIVLFYSSSLYIVCFSVLTSVIVLWMSTTPHTKPLPWIIKQHLLGRMGSFLLLPKYNFHGTTSVTQRVTAEEMRDHQVTDFEENEGDDDHHIINSTPKPSVQQEWIILATAIDRISFIGYGLVFAIIAAVYSV